MTERGGPMAPDEVLLARWCDGDRPAGDRLIERHFKSLLLYFRSKLSSEDDVQELVQTTLATCTELKERRRLGQVVSFRAYLFGIARNVLLRFYSRSHAAMPLDDIASVPVADISPGPSTLVKMQQRVDTLLLAMAKLSIDQQTALQLKYWSGMTQREVADALGVPAGTAARRIHTATRKLAEAYAAGRDDSSSPSPVDDGELRGLLSAMARRLL